MPQAIDLPDDLADALRDEASRLGMSLPAYAVRLLASVHPAPPSIRTGAELVAFLDAEGLIGSRPDITDSQAYARQLRERAQHRQP